MRRQIPDDIAGGVPHGLERLAAVCLKAEAQDSRLGDLSERYVRTRERVRFCLGATRFAMTVSHLAADLQYLFTAADVVLFARAVDPALRLAEPGGRQIFGADLKERAMTMLHDTARKLLLPALLLVAGAFLLNSAVNVWSTWRETEGLIVDLQREKANATAKQIDSYLAMLQDQVGWVTQGTGGASSDQRRGDYLRLLRQAPAITEIVELNGEGKEVLRVSRLRKDTVDSGADFSSDARFTEAVKHKKHVSTIYFNKQSEPYLSIAMANAGTNSGVTVAEVNIKRLWDLVDSVKVGDAGYVYVVDADSHLIASRDKAQVLRRADLVRLPQVAAAQSQTIGDRVMFDNSPSGRAVLSVHAPLSAAPWKVFVELPVAEARGPLWSALFRTGCLLGLGLLAILLASFATVRRDIGMQPARS